MKQYSFLQENNIGSFSHSPLFYVVTYGGDEGTIPHFHIYAQDNKKKINICIQIEDNRYFEHDKYRGTITDGKIRKQLVKFLKEKPSTFKGRNFKTNWDWIKHVWNSGNNLLKATRKDIPDYTTIKPYKESK